MNEYNEYLSFAKEIANYAGKVMLKYFNDNNGEKYKDDNTIVTLADTEINEYLIKQVKEKYPNLYKEVYEHNKISRSSWYEFSKKAYDEYRKYLKDNTIGYID